MKRGARLISAAAFAGLATIVVGASLTWACTGPTFGTPAEPGAPPPPAPEPTPPSPAPTSPTPPPPGEGAGPAPGPANSGGTSGSGTTSGDRTLPKPDPANRGDAGAPARGGAGRSGATAPVAPGVAGMHAVAGTQFAQRARGATAGVTARGGQAVFASPAARATGSRAARAGARAAASPRSASADLWSGFKPGAGSSVFAAETSAGQQGGGVPLTVALAVLGLGLAGLVGSASVLALRRRQAGAKATPDSSSGTAKM